MKKRTGKKVSTSKRVSTSKKVPMGKKVSTSKEDSQEKVMYCCSKCDFKGYYAEEKKWQPGEKCPNQTCDGTIVECDKFSWNVDYLKTKTGT